MACFKLLLFILCFYHNHATKTMKMVHLVYRHGARSPLKFYPKGKYQEDDWHDGSGQLTQIGMMLEYDLGKFLKNRYINSSFINRTYSHRQVYIRSSDRDKCLQSAECLLVGLYPPQGYQIWSKQLLWQPIPVHTIPGNNDPLLRSHAANCPRLDEIRDENEHTAKYKAKAVKHHKLLANVSKLTGRDVPLGDLWEITDSLISEKTDGKIIPLWAEELWNEMDKVANWVFVDTYRGNDELGRLTGGPLLAKIIDNMKKWIENSHISPEDNTTQHKLYKLNIFSGHDVSLLSLTCALDVKIDVPVFASCIMIELYHSPATGYTVEMRYRNDYTGNLQQLKLKKCKFSCPLTQFIQLTKQRVSVDRQKECGLVREEDVGFFTLSRLKVLLVIFFVLTILLLITVVIICYYRRSVFIATFCGKPQTSTDDGIVLS